MSTISLLTERPWCAPSRRNPRRRRLAARRALLPSSRRRAAPGGVGRRDARRWRSSSRSTTRRARGSPPTSDAPPARLPVSVRELVLALDPGRGRGHPGRRRAPARSCNNAGGASGSSCSPAPPARAVARLLDVVLDLHPRRRGRRDQRHLGRVDAVPVARVRRGRGRRDDGRQAVARAPWKRAADLALLVLIGAMAIAGSAGVPELVLAVAAGASVGAARARRSSVRRIAGRRRRPSPAHSATRASTSATCARARRRRSGAALPRGRLANGRRAFVKVYAQDSRDADLLYRGYRTLLLRGPNDDWPSLSLEHDVEHEALMLLMARHGGVTLSRRSKRSPPSPTARWRSRWSTSAGARLDELAPSEIDADLLDAIWREVARLHRARASRTERCTPSNILVAAGRARDHRHGLRQGVGLAPAAGHRPRRAARFAGRDRRRGPGRRVGGAGARPVGPGERRAVPPAVGALGARTRKQVSKSLLQELRTGIATVTGEEAPPLERLVRVRPRTLMLIAVAGRRVLLPAAATRRRRRQLHGPAFRELRLAGRVRGHVAADVRRLRDRPAGWCARPSPVRRERSEPRPRRRSSIASRPANVGGMALNVRFMQKAGIEPAQAVTGMGLNVLAGGVVHAGPAVPVRRLGRAIERGLQDPGEQQAARDHRGRARDRRHRRRDAMGSPADPHTCACAS